jgi:hypothetical protein
MVKVFQHLGLPLFQATYVHDHWKIMKNWNFDTIKMQCVEGSALHEDRDGGDGHDDYDDGTGGDADEATSNALALPGVPETNVNPVVQQQKLYTGSASVVSSKNRYIFAKKLFDQVAGYFPNKEIFNGFVDVVRSVLVTCSSSDVSDGFERIKAYVTVDPRLQKQPENASNCYPFVEKRKDGEKSVPEGKW